MTRRLVAIPEGGFRRIAVLRLSSLGDVILALPLVEALKQRFPEARLEFWVKEEYAEAVRFHPAIDHVRRLDADARRIEDLVSMSAELEDCDLVVDLQGNARSRVLSFRLKAPVLRASSYRLRRMRWVKARWTRPAPVPTTLARYAAALAPLGLAATGTPRVHAGPDAEAWADGWMAREWPEASGPLVALCPGARHWTKRWPEEHWVELHRRLIAGTTARLVVLSTPAECRGLAALAAEVAGEPRARWVLEPVARVGALLSRCRTAVTGDSGLMHLAAARGLAVVAMFGSTSPDLGFAPAGEGHAVLCRREPCQPCTLHGLERCPKGHFRCMRLLDAATVETEVRARL